MGVGREEGVGMGGCYMIFCSLFQCRSCRVGAGSEGGEYTYRTQGRSLETIM